MTIRNSPCRPEGKSGRGLTSPGCSASWSWRSRLRSQGGEAYGSLPDGRQLHLGVEKPFRPGEKAHPAFGCAALDDLARRLEQGGHPVRWDGAPAPRRRFYSEDPFGNRIEFIEP